MRVRVYFHGEVGSRITLVPVYRTVPRTAAVVTAALGELLAGPTRAEQAAGIQSPFSARTAGMLRSVRIAERVAYVDFDDLGAALTRLSGSSVGPAAGTEIDATVRQFPGVTKVVNGRARVLGRGQFTGRPEQLFSAEVRYQTPTTRTGWVVVIEGSIETVDGYQRGEPLGGDAIPVVFTS
jgi:hypothetical protein